jgi:hypothetical protein
LSPSVYIFDNRISASSDDAEEYSSGVMYLNSSDLELVYSVGNQTVGMRFNGVNIPSSAIITNAYIQFKVDEAASVDTFLKIEAEAVDNATTFVNQDQNISSRSRTVSHVDWNPMPWLTVGEASIDQQTPNIASVIQEVVDRPGWVSGNSLVLIISGSGERVVEAYEGDQAGAPLLHIEYEVDGE